MIAVMMTSSIEIALELVSLFLDLDPLLSGRFQAEGQKNFKIIEDLAQKRVSLT